MKLFTQPTAVLTIEEMTNDLAQYHSNNNSIRDFMLGIPRNFERFQGIAKKYESLITEWVNLCADNFYDKHPEVYHILVETEETEEGYCRWVCSWTQDERENHKV